MIYSITHVSTREERQEYTVGVHVDHFIEARQRFWEDGAICIRQAFSLDWIERLREAVEKGLDSPGPLHKNRTSAGSPGRFFVDFQLWRRFDECSDFIRNSPAPQLMANLLGSETLTFYHDHLLVKEPGAIDATPWHHDQPYYPVEGKQIGSIWLPLDPVDRRTCVEYVRGSHRWGKWFAPQYFNSSASGLVVQDPRFETIPDISAMRDRVEFLSWDMKPGDCIVFHGLTVHGAPGNSSTTRRRRAWATRWCGDDIRYTERMGEVSPPLHGHGLKSGDSMTCELFPRVWPRTLN